MNNLTEQAYGPLQESIISKYDSLAHTDVKMNEYSLGETYSTLPVSGPNSSNIKNNMRFKCLPLSN